MAGDALKCAAIEQSVKGKLRSILSQAVEWKRRGQAAMKETEAFIESVKAALADIE
jgi:hypothetical protein